MSRPAERGEVLVDGVRLSFLEWGTRTAGEPSLVMLHGLVASAATFERLVDALEDIAPGSHIIAFDMPGAGFSDRPASADVSFTGMARFIAHALATLGIARPILLGHSHGGAIALRLAADDPTQLRGLILLCPAHPFSGAETTLVRFYLSPPGRLFGHCLPLTPRWLLRLAFRSMPGQRDHFTDRDLEPYVHTLRGPGTIRHLLRLLSHWQSDMASLARDLIGQPITLPTLVFWGDRDTVVPIRRAEALFAHLDGPTLVRLPSIGHLPNEECPALCAERIHSWMLRNH